MLTWRLVRDFLRLSRMRLRMEEISRLNCCTAGFEGVACLSVRLRVSTSWLYSSMTLLRPEGMPTFVGRSWSLAEELAIRRTESTISSWVPMSMSFFVLSLAFWRLSSAWVCRSAILLADLKFSLRLSMPPSSFVIRSSLSSIKLAVATASAFLSLMASPLYWRMSSLRTSSERTGFTPVRLSSIIEDVFCGITTEMEASS